MGQAGLLSGVKDAGNVRFIGLTSNELGLDLDYANKFELNLSEDGRDYAMVNGVVQAVAFPGQITGTLTIGLDLINGDIQAFMLRSKMLKGLNDILKCEKFKLTEDNQILTTKETPTQIFEVCTLKRDNSKKQRLANAILNEDGKVVASGGKVGDVVRVYYLTQKNVNHFTMTTDEEVSENYIAYADVIGKTWAGGDAMPFQYKLYSTSPQKSLDLQYDGSAVSNFELTFDILADVDGNIVTYSEVNEDTEELPETAIIPTVVVAVADDTANTVTLGFTKPENATSIILKYSTDDSTWTEVNTEGSGSEISIPAPLTSSNDNVVVSNITGSGTYKFKLVVDGVDSSISNGVTFTA